jgi:hypothetical protein
MQPSAKVFDLSEQFNRRLGNTRAKLLEDSAIKIAEICNLILNIFSTVILTGIIFNFFPGSWV